MEEGYLKNISSMMARPKPTSDYSDNIKVTTLPLIGRVHIVRDTNGQLQVFGIVVYWVYGTLTSLFIIMLPQYNDGHCPGFLIAAFLFVSVMTLLSLIKASITNPGRIPLLTEDSTVDTTDWTYCKICDRKRPKRAHHCRRCQQCVMRMDHHCPWINNCVGEENHFAFFLLILYAFLLGTFALALTIFHFWVWPKCISCDKEAFYIKHGIWFVYLQVVLAVNMSLVMFIQLSHLNFNLLLDITTLETMQSELSIANATLRKTYSAYRDLCGRTSIFLWWWPCRRRYPVLMQKNHNSV